MEKQKQNSYWIFKVVVPERMYKPFWIIENYATCDGVRSRITDLKFHSAEEAQHRIDSMKD